MIIRKIKAIGAMVLAAMSLVAAQNVTDPLPYAKIANPLPDTMDQLYRDSVNLQISPIRLNQAGYRPQDKKYFYYVGTGGSTFTVINEAGTTVGSGTLSATGQNSSGQIKIRASNNATLVTGGDTRYTMTSPISSGAISEGVIPNDIPPGVYRIVVGNTTSHRFIIDERVYSHVRDALLKFYGVNRCGDSNSWFHKPCHLKDAVTGGWHDCGDHLKEGATMSYTAAVLGLAAAAFFDRDADVYSANQGITQLTDGIPDILYEAKHGADFILQSFDKAGGKPAGMITSIGGFGNTGCGDDHSWWGQPENQDKMPAARGGPPRCARNEVNADYMAKYAANLAFVSKRMIPYDAAYADRCLKAAVALYEHSKVNLRNTNTSAYNGGTIVSDDMAFGCLALLWATGERKYLDELCFDKTIGVKQNGDVFPKLFQGGWFTNNDPLFSHTMANTDWASVQAHVLWGFFRLVLNDKDFCTDLGLTENERLGLIEKTAYNLIANLSSVGQGTRTIPLPTSGMWVESIIKYDLPWFTMHTQMEWVWNRYQSGNITEMYYYYDMASKIEGLEFPNTPASTTWKADTVKTILVRMLDYMFGVNPWDISMVYGVGEKNFNHPHHRAANPEGKNVPGAFYKYRPPVGALQGGYMPTTSLYSEHYDDYMHSETGIDGTTNILMPVIGLAKEDTLGPPTGTVRIVYVGCDEAIIEVRQSRYGNAEVHFGKDKALTQTKVSDSSGVLHRITLENLTQGTAYTFNVVVTDVFGRSSTLQYLNEEKKYENFSFTTLQNCPTNAEISNVKVCKVTNDSAEIFWYTPNGNFDSKVVYGEQKPPATVQNGDITGHPVKFHYVKLGGLKEKTTYYFYVESGESRDDNKGELYTFTTPVEHVEFDVRTLRYTWGTQPGIGINIVNQDVKSYDSLDLRLYFRDKEGFEKDLGARIDIMVLYREDGFQDTIGGALRTAIWKNLATQKPTKMPDTYNAEDQTYAYYFSIPLWGVEMRSQSRIRLDIIFDRWEQTRLQDLLGMAPLHQINNADWSFGSHSRAAGDPVDFPGVPILPKEDVDATYWLQPINSYVTIYRKNEYVWGYSPSQEETKTKKTHYTITTQVTAPLNNPSNDYVFCEGPIGLVNITGWAKVGPVEGTLNDIWVNGVRQADPSALAVWSEAEQRYNFTIPAKVKNGPNEIDVTLFAGPTATCEECYGCAVSNHHFFVEFQGAKQYPSTLVLRDVSNLPISDTVHLDTTTFNIIVTDRNGNVKGSIKDNVAVKIVNLDNGDSTIVYLAETDDSTGIFMTTTPISVVDKTPQQTGEREIAMNGGDRVRIWYIDPTDSTDISEAFIFSKASFPVAKRGYLKDTDGDGSVDNVTVEYTIPLKVNPDSINISFPASVNANMSRSSEGGMTCTGNVLTVVPVKPYVNGVTSFSSASSGEGISYLTSAGLVRTKNFPVYDSIGPVLNGQAVIWEREANGADLAGGDDTVQVTFSEGSSALKGDMFLLRKNGIDYPLTYIAKLSLQTESNTAVLLINSKGIQFAAGDSIYLNSASTFTDVSGNRPHVANRRVPVVIKAASPSIRQAYYKDTDNNGQIDKITIEFSKPLSQGSGTFGLRWNKQTVLNIAQGSVAVSPSGTTIVISVGPELTANEIVTSGELFAYYKDNNSPDTASSEVIDSAAPVIHSATFYLSGKKDKVYGYIDTLDVLFSEGVRNVEGIKVFNLYSNTAAAGYNFTITDKKMISQEKFRFYGVVAGVEYPVSGDLIWLPINANVTDQRGNSQDAENNRRAPVKVADVHLSLKDVIITKGPNPFGPRGGEIFVVKIISDSRFPMQLDSSARTIIYDKVGNVIAEPLPVKINNGIEILWNGTNKRGRIVGSGTYLMILYFKGEQVQILVGVTNK